MFIGIVASVCVCAQIKHHRNHTKVAVQLEISARCRP